MTAKELWESLERKYKTEDAGTKKFVVARFLDYKMVDSKNVISQVLLHDIHAEGMTLSETFQVDAIMKVASMLEDNKLAQKDTYAPDSAKANMVEHAGSSSRSNSKGKGKDKKKNDKKGKGKSEYLAPKAGIMKQKFQGTCYNCDQPGHRAANCKMPKRVNPRQANMVDENVDMIAMVSDVCAMISEVNLVGVGDVILKMTSEKELKLTNVLYVRRIAESCDTSYELRNGLVLSQAHYVDKILNTHNAGDSGQARTPIDTSLHLSKNRGLGVAQLEYSRIIGMLMYLMTGTRPDLAYAVSRLSRYTSNPSYAHWKAITRVLHYLRYSRDYGLHYDRHPAVIEGYSDANWISDIKDSRSTSGYVFTLGGAAISWKSSKQTVIAKSTMESEFIALDKCGEEAEWLRQFVEDIPRWPKPVTAISIHCDSKSAMGRAKSTMYNGKSRHIRRRHNSIRQLLSTGVISIDYVASKDNIADPFTKGLSRELVSKSSKGMGLKPLKE
ncbi:zinc finger, CCHC-type containing protein [Tanacetum coccineum]